MLSKRKLIFNIGMLLIPWLSLLLLEKKDIRRFFPAAFIVIILEMITEKIGQKRKWWIFYSNPNKFVLNELFFSMGPFLIGSIWILKLTYGNIKNFILVNAAADGFFAFVLTRILKKIKIARLERFSEFQFFIYMFCKVPFLYGAQYLFDKRM
ncbi:MAG: hypothetical protein ACK4M9_11460 [Anaerobacillus sp.]|uniref:hypothetical protein n=1 Tax=Anaerobacillus sp. TaxID=1872506 RepID=UPI003918B45A